ADVDPGPARVVPRVQAAGGVRAAEVLTGGDRALQLVGAAADDPAVVRPVVAVEVGPGPPVGVARVHGACARVRAETGAGRQRALQAVATEDRARIRAPVAVEVDPGNAAGRLNSLEAEGGRVGGGGTGHRPADDHDHADREPNQMTPEAAGEEKLSHLF